MTKLLGALSALGLSGLVIWLLWFHRYLPLVDEAAVAYSGRVYHLLRSDPAFFSQWYTLRPSITHRVFYELLHVLQWLLPVRLAQKACLTFAVLSIPAAAAFFCRVHGRSPVLGLAAFPLGLGYMCAMGYTPFLLGIPLVPLVLGWLELGLEESRPLRQKTGCLLAAALSLPLGFALHAALAAILAILAGVWITLRRAPLRTTGLRLAVLLGLCCGGSLLSSGGLPGPIPPGTFTPRALGQALEKLPTHFFLWTTEGYDGFFIALWAILLAVAAGFTLRRGSLQQTDLRILAALLLSCLGYFITPEHLHWPWVTWSTAARWPLFAGFFLSVLPSIRTGDAREHRWVIAPILLGAGAIATLLAPFQSYAAHTDSLEILAAQVKPHARVLPLSLTDDAHGPRTQFGSFVLHPYRQAAKWVAVETDSHQPYSFCHLAYHPVDCPALPPAPAEVVRSGFRSSTFEQYDYVVLYAGANTPLLTPTLAHRSGMPLLLVTHRGPWYLYRTRAGL